MLWLLQGPRLILNVFHVVSPDAYENQPSSSWHHQIIVIITHLTTVPKIVGAYLTSQILSNETFFALSRVHKTWNEREVADFRPEQAV
jgi:hypothetical protein